MVLGFHQLLLGIGSCGGNLLANIINSFFASLQSNHDAQLENLEPGQNGIGDLVATTWLPGWDSKVGTLLPAKQYLVSHLRIRSTCGSCKIEQRR